MADEGRRVQELCAQAPRVAVVEMSYPAHRRGSHPLLCYRPFTIVFRQLAQPPLEAKSGSPPQPAMVAEHRPTQEGNAGGDRKHHTLAGVQRQPVGYQKLAHLVKKGVQTLELYHKGTRDIR